MSGSSSPYVNVLITPLPETLVISLCILLFRSETCYAVFFLSHLPLNTEQQAFGCKNKTKIAVLMLKWIELCSSEC